MPKSRIRSRQVIDVKNGITLADVENNLVNFLCGTIEKVDAKTNREHVEARRVQIIQA